MYYQINWQKCGNMFAVPQKLISSINVFDENSLKVALYIFSHPKKAEVDILCNELNLTQKQMKQALLVLEKQGIVELSEKEEKRKILKTPLKLKKEEFNKIVDSEEAVKFLLDETQQILGRTLTHSEASTFVELHKFYGLDIDVILMILSYCLSLKKDNISYIQKVAIDWAKRGITNHQEAEEYLQTLEIEDECAKVVKQLFGITGRTMTKKERQFSASWISDMKFELNMIVDAFERCIQNLGKISFPYINKVLVSWHKKGYTTLLDVQREEETQMKMSAMEESSFDLNDLEELLNQSPIYDKGAALK